ncbi:OX-2 membrane glycoprotein-like isoform X2 [Rhinatrema bivittatum]|uniref:OX-2 membrane glycoprotein-like isoform X2 n=1 Tax=Rhinatrema bivittatum TaxID=194408 RepID=UPI0011294559|nr:OX-2 membrane glycoprotein-like isoform X2 [Rhinatrema bivittatum]
MSSRRQAWFVESVYATPKIFFLKLAPDLNTRGEEVRGCSACCLCFGDLIFWVISVALCSTQGDVLTEEKRMEKLGSSVTLKCALQKHYEVVQVTWQKRTGTDQENLATYSSAKGANVMKAYQEHLNVTLLRLNETAITLWRTSILDEGCYLCIFNIYPSGSIQGTTCLFLHGDILTEEKKVVKLGEAASLKCTLQKYYDVLQVTWQKTGKVPENLATYTSAKGATVMSAHQDHMNFTLLGLNETAITLWRTRIQDEGCYVCIFNTFPSGSIQGKTCLFIYEQLWGSLQYTVSHGQLNAICVATGWPAPMLSWPRMEKSPGNTSKVENANGTVTVTSWVFLNDSQSFHGRELVCRALQNQDEFFYRKVVEKSHGLSPFSIALIVIAVTLSVLAVILIVVYCRKRQRMWSGH